MKINILLITTFLSIVIYAGINFETGITGTTRLNGEGCICHSLTKNDSVNVWIEGPDSVFLGDTSSYKIYLSGGSAVKGGFNVAAMIGTLESADSTSYISSNELTHSFPLEFTSDTIGWEFNYIAMDSIGIDTIYSVANSTNADGNPQVGDEWNFGENFAVNIVEEIIPVEFTSFIASQDEYKVILRWSTATETNNAGFEVQRAIEGNRFLDIGFVKGHGTSASYKDYSFKDEIKKPGFYNYRLKQIDFDGNHNFSNVINLEVIVTAFSLAQNYPNPFNPTTTIKYTILSPHFNKGGETGGFVTIKVFDVLGNEIATLVNQQKPAGNYEVEFSTTEIGSNLTTGVYLYQLRAGSFIETKKMILMK